MYKKVDMGSMKYIHKRLLKRLFIEMKKHDWLSEQTLLQHVCTPILFIDANSDLVCCCPCDFGNVRKKKESMKNRKTAKEIKKAGGLVTRYY